jgi:hypothetical protein
LLARAEHVFAVGSPAPLLSPLIALLLTQA